MDQYLCIELAELDEETLSALRGFLQSYQIPTAPASQVAEDVMKERS